MRSLNNHQKCNLVVLLGLFLLSGWYLWDSWRASTHIYNLILVLPLCVSLLVLCLLAFCREILAPPAAVENDGGDSEKGVLLVILLFIGYVITLPLLGFDLGTFAFVALFLRLTGEKKWQWALGYGLVFALSSALFFSYMLPYPMPLLLLPGGN